MAYLNELDQGRNNNFNLIRLIAAVMVIFSHTYLVTGTFKQELLLKLCGFLDFGALGVKIFFTISGYLITKSLFRHSDFYGFVWARTLRIFPGLLATALFCAFVIGPLCTTLPLARYFNLSILFDYVWRLASLHNFKNALPGVFNSNIYPNSINSPIWTLPAEILLYVQVFICGIVVLVWRKDLQTLKKSMPLLLIVAGFFYGVTYTAWYMRYVIFEWDMPFITGMCFYFLNDKIKVSISFFIMMLIGFLILFHYKFYFQYAFNLVLAYGIFLFAYHPKLQISIFKHRGDFSYGLYIYTFPIQQLLISNYHITGILQNFTISLIISFPLSIASWYLIEKPMLSLKSISLFKAQAKQLKPIF